MCAVSTRPSAAKLDALREVGDQPADDYVKQNGPTWGYGGGIRQVISRLRSLPGNDPFVRDWRAANGPSQPQLDGLVGGQRFFSDWGLDIVVALWCAALPADYAAPKGVAVLQQASQLDNQATAARRIAETGRMIEAVCAPDGLMPGHEGFVRVRDVRLLHACIRAELLNGGNFAAPVLGVPVNQEDLLGTLLSFTTVVFSGLRRLGLPIDDAGCSSYLQLWAVVGEHLGIQEAAAIRDLADAEQLTTIVANRLQAPSAAGSSLMAVLLREMEISMPWGARKLPRTLVRQLAGDPIADMLEVPSAAWWAPLLRASTALTRVASRFPGGVALLQAPSRLVGRSVIRAWVDRTIAGEQSPPFKISQQTLDRWRIGTSPHRHRLTYRGRRRQRRRAARLRQTETAGGLNRSGRRRT